MARLQILELPEGSGDDRPPFVLVVDQMPADESGFEALRRDLADGNLAERIGARAVLVFEEAVDIPANDMSGYVRDDTGLKVGQQEWVVKMDTPVAVHHANDDGLKVRDKDAELRAANEWIERLHAELEELRQQTRHSEEAEAIRKRVAKEQKAALTDALGMGRLRDWDDIRNAATALRKQRDEQAEAIERVRNLHRPVEHRGQTICWECSDYDFPGQTTDSAPVAYGQCATLRVLDGDTERSPEE
ncbi:hypothetical protein ACFZAO_05300 [Streptomyces griseoaurantiacus]|uniref:hypothetical protein n=1 Tax=Streptomyces griseoaurantiacus TaxID=68213 RepID=UPI0036E80759